MTDATPVLGWYLKDRVLDASDGRLHTARGAGVPLTSEETAVFRAIAAGRPLPASPSEEVLVALAERGGSLLGFHPFRFPRDAAAALVDAAEGDDARLVARLRAASDRGGVVLGARAPIDERAPHDPCALRPRAEPGRDAPGPGDFLLAARGALATRGIAAVHVRSATLAAMLFGVAPAARTTIEVLSVDLEALRLGRFLASERPSPARPSAEDLPLWTLASLRWIGEIEEQQAAPSFELAEAAWALFGSVPRVTAEAWPLAETARGELEGDDRVAWCPSLPPAPRQGAAAPPGVVLVTSHDDAEAAARLAAALRARGGGLVGVLWDGGRSVGIRGDGTSTATDDVEPRAVLLHGPRLDARCLRAEAGLAGIPVATLEDLERGLAALAH